MKTTLIAEYPVNAAQPHSIRVAIELFEGPYNTGIIAKYKRDVRSYGGRVVAVIRPKC